MPSSRNSEYSPHSTVLRLEKVSKTYVTEHHQVAALNQLSLTIEPGEFLTIVGASGSGKSTLLNVLGLLDIPEEGKFFIDGKDALTVSPAERAQIRSQSIGFVFQQFHLLPRYNALENVKLPLLYSPQSISDELPKSLLEQVGLKERIYHSPNELSGGEQQRVAIARSLVNSPSCLLADEPTGNLDAKSRNQIMDIITDLNQSGKTIIIVTHEPHVADFGHRTITIEKGQIKEESKKTISSPPPPSEITENREPSPPENSSHPLPPQGWKRYKKEFTSILYEAWRSIIVFRDRTLLSVLGSLIGVAALISTLAIGAGAREAINEKLASLGTNRIVIQPHAAKFSANAQRTEAISRLTLKDYDQLRKKSNLFSAISPVIHQSMQATYRTSSWKSDVHGVTNDYFIIQDHKLKYGRTFTNEENAKRNRVIILGSKLAHALFQEKNPLGKHIRINGILFLVVGVLESKGIYASKNTDYISLVPVETALHRLFGTPFIQSIEANVVEENKIKTAQLVIPQLLKELRSRHMESNVKYDIINMSAVRDARASTTNNVSWLFTCIATISLVVAGIGIMNMMLISVNERTHEIGLRKALGAGNHHILQQFIYEAGIIAALGVLVGLVVGVIVTLVIAEWLNWIAVFSIGSLLLAFLFCTGIGIIFGIWPARKASNLHPIEALRQS